MKHTALFPDVMIIYAAALLLIAAALLLIYRYVRTPGERPGRQGVAMLAIGVGLPLLLLGYALFFSPYARLCAPETADSSRADAELLRMGAGLFRVHCAVCHGEDGRAPDGKGANLTRRISFDSALRNIQRGANNFKRTFPGGMPPMIADTRRAAQVAHYVSSGFSENEEGELLYGMLRCERCHGPEGRGLQFLGPNIRSFDLQTVALVLKNGKNGVIGKMPRFERFSEEEIRALGLYVMQLERTR